MEILHRITNFVNNFTAILLFLAAMYISEGKKSLRSYRITIVLANLLLGLYLIVSPGIIIFTGSNASGGEQLIMLSSYFFIEATFLLCLTNILTCYYYLKIWREVPSNSPIRRVSSFIIGGTFLLPISHFLLVLPLVFRSMNIENNTLGFSALYSIGILLASLFITIGHRTKISDRIND